VILLILVVVLWIVVLAPSAWRHRAERQGAGSIDHFHHQLQLLEHAGPKMVTPAYRLHTAVPGGGGGEALAPGVDSSRPKLVLLRPTDDEDSADVDGLDGCHYERVGVLAPPEASSCLAQPQYELSAYRRQQARRRCTLMLRCLTGIAITTGILGLVPSMRLAWVFTAATGLAALGLVGLMGYAREVQAQRRSRLPTGARRGADADSFPAAAAAGYPGGWDEGFERSEPVALAR
jgi:hypothetical protein